MPALNAESGKPPASSETAEKRTECAETFWRSDSVRLYPGFALQLFENVPHTQPRLFQWPVQPASFYEKSVSFIYTTYMKGVGIHETQKIRQNRLESV
jgi:hypothetical protein